MKSQKVQPVRRVERASLESPWLHLSEEEWFERAARYEQRFKQWIDSHLLRASRHEKHPIFDFLFDYYSFSPGSLRRWSPGPGVVLEGKKACERYANLKGFIANRGGISLSPFPSHRLGYVDWAIQFLEATSKREPFFGCFGLHEWAMVYRDSKIRHGEVCLRLSSDDLASFVESQQLACTHYDAFRFFTGAARPRNARTLSPTNAPEMDQRGCVHANMDLYRFCYKLYPWVDSCQLGDAFEMALMAREADMRASPYDLRKFGFEPIRIETAEGRTEYVQIQKRIAQQATRIRSGVLEAYRKIKRYFS